VLRFPFLGFRFLVAVEFGGVFLVGRESGFVDAIIVVVHILYIDRLAGKAVVVDHLDLEILLFLVSHRALLPSGYFNFLSSLYSLRISFSSSESLFLTSSSILSLRSLSLSSSFLCFTFLIHLSIVLPAVSLSEMPGEEKSASVISACPGRS